MDRPDLHTREWRELPRDGDCVAEFIFGEAAGPCHGVMHRHHVRPGDPAASRTYLACAGHHPLIESFLRRLQRRADRVLGYRRCPHRPGVHRYPGAREACERQLNARAA
jgi:hypothetical protein